MKITRVIGSLLLLAIGGFAQDVRYKFDRSADFSKYRTYKWVKVKDAAQLGQLADQQLKSAVDAEFAMKGLVKSNGSTDLDVAYQGNQ